MKLFLAKLLNSGLPALLLASSSLGLSSAVAKDSEFSPAVIDTRLGSRCPESPNCISSVYSDDHSHYMPPLKVKNVDTAVATAMTVIEQMGGQIQNSKTVDQPAAFSASFTSRWLRFVDDVDIGLDAKAGLLHFRSASRVGYSDFGVNKARMQSFRDEFERRQSRLSSAD